MKYESKFTIKDLVLLGSMNAVLVVLSYAVVMLLHLVPPLWGFMDPITNILLAPVYMLMIRLVPKMFVMTIHGAVIGSFYMLTGWWPGLLAALLAGLAADCIASLMGGYGNSKAVFVSVPVFATFKTLLFYAPLYSYVLVPAFNDVVASWPPEAVEGYTVGFAVIVLTVNLVCCLAGLAFGRRMIARHFGRAGMVTA